MNPITRARAAEERAARLASREPDQAVIEERARIYAAREAAIEAEQARDRAALVQPVQAAFGLLKAKLGPSFPGVARELLRIDFAQLRACLAKAVAQDDAAQRTSEDAARRAYFAGQTAA